ncbi:hypothetical protein Pmar_PMAR021464, partial [Perkinsus marinus ATCC 50983]
MREASDIRQCVQEPIQVRRSSLRLKEAQRMQHMDEMIQDHLRRNPKILKPEGVARDWEFREAVRKRFGIIYHKTLRSWAYRSSQGCMRYKACSNEGVLSTLRIICKQQADTEGVEGFNTADGSRKRKFQGGPSASKQSVNRLEEPPVTSTMVSGAAEQGRLPDLPDGVMAKLRRFEEGVAVDSRSADLDRIAVLRAEVENWKDKARAMEKEREAAVEELERVRKDNEEKLTLRGELKTLQGATEALKEMVSAAKEFGRVEDGA